MLHLAFVHTELADSYQAGLALGHAITDQIPGRVDAVILFAPPLYCDQQMLAALKELCPAAIIIGRTTGNAEMSETGPVNIPGRIQCSALALSADYDDMSFSASLGQNLSTRFENAVWTLNASLQTGPLGNYPYHTALLFAHASESQLASLINQLVFLTGGSFAFFGAGTLLENDIQQQPHTVYYDTQVHTDAAALLIIHSRRPIGLGVCHGWRKSQQPVQVTRAQGHHILELNHLPPLEALQVQLTNEERLHIKDHPHMLAATTYDTIEHQHSQKHVPLTVQKNGTLFCPTAIPQETTLSLLIPVTSPAEAVRIATQQALKHLPGNQTATAFLFESTQMYPHETEHEEIMRILSEQLSAQVSIQTCRTEGQLIHSTGIASGYYCGLTIVGLLPDAQ